MHRKENESSGLRELKRDSSLDENETKQNDDDAISSSFSHRFFCSRRSNLTQPSNDSFSCHVMTLLGLTFLKNSFNDVLSSILWDDSHSLCWNVTKSSLVFPSSTLLLYQMDFPAQSLGLIKRWWPGHSKKKTKLERQRGVAVKIWKQEMKCDDETSSPRVLLSYSLLSLSLFLFPVIFYSSTMNSPLFLLPFHGISSSCRRCCCCSV